MFNPRRILLAFSPAAALAVIAAAVAAPPSRSNTEPAHLEVYKSPSGESFFALSLTPEGELPRASAHEVVVLFDTSASQAGVYRDKALESLKTTLSSFDADTQVGLMAVDLNAIPLTDKLVAPSSKEMAAGVAKLERRVPLGTTDLPEAFKAASERFSENAKATRSVIYIGDGISNANFAADELRGLIRSLADNQISASCLSIGPRTDTVLLAALANQTGGVLVIDREELAAKEIGIRLAGAAEEVVVWPSDAEFPDSLAEVYPAKVPPLRTDRDTVIVGKGAITGGARINISGQALGQPVDLTWKVFPREPNVENSYLIQLVEIASSDEAYRLPTLGTEGLLESRRLINLGVDNLTTMSRQAAAAGNVEQARRLADEAIHRDPLNLDAMAIRRVAKAQSRIPNAVRTPADKGDLRLIKQQAFRKQADADDVAEAEDALPPPPADDGDEGRFLEEFERENRLAQNILIKEIEVGTIRARDRMGEDPAGAMQDLKLLLERVMQAPEIDAETRSRVRDRLEAALRDAARRITEKEAEDLEARQRYAAAEDEIRLLENLNRDKQRIKQLMDRFNALMAEGRYKEAEETAAVEVRSLDPDLPDAVVANLIARTTGYHINNMIIREAKQKGIMDQLFTIDKSSVVFPDEPPILYPEASVWIELTRRREKYKAVDLKSQGGAEEKIMTELDKPTQLDFIETPLTDVIDTLRDFHGIPIQIDTKSLEDAGIGSDTPITRSLKGVTLRSALRLLLRDLELTYVIQDEVLLITTPDAAGARLVTKVYPVGDLVLPIGGGSGNLFGLGGQTQIGGGGGGLGGGVGGGQGFGGGGGQQGGGGGFGFQNVRDDLLIPPPAAAGLKAMAVQDDLKLAPPGGSQVPAAKLGPAPKAKLIKLNIPEGADAEAVWSKYFASLPAEGDTTDEAQLAAFRKAEREQRAALRETARQLMKSAKFEELIAMTRAALRHGHVQPWMYEAMVLAMQAGDHPAEEIERALMSAADFSNGASDLMYLATYMSRLGLDTRALKIFRQVSSVEPTRHEPLMHGLRIAQRLKDVDAIRWACAGVLSQAWPADKNDIVQEAQNAAEATLERLTSEGRSQEAVEFRAAVDSSKARDCLVRVSWTGDADVDLLVEEPTGSVCSYRNPRTTAGGVMRGDPNATPGQLSSAGYAEEYVVPQSFSGNYRMLLRRVWGKVAAGKVTVDVYAHYGTDKQQHMRKQIPIADKDAVIVWDIKDGRRKEPLAQAQLANAAAAQVAVNRAILAQQLNGLFDPSSLGAFSTSRGGDGSTADPLGFVRRRGGVGFQPVITTLPEGANMSVTAVISSDRRYVRITPSPVFSSIGEVFQFNFSAGSTTDITDVIGGGGAGGGGFGN